VSQPSILVDDTGHARLTDFGLAAVTPEVGSAGSIKDGHAVRWAAPEVLDKGRSVSKESDVYSFAMVVIEVWIRNLLRISCVTYRYKAFTGIAPFYGIPPTTVAVGILSGDRPTRPTHPSLTNDLWGMTERCWNQDPQHRPDISEVVRCLQTSLVLRRDHVDLNENQAPDDTTSGGFQQTELSLGEYLTFTFQEAIPSVIESAAFPTVPLDARFLCCERTILAREVIPCTPTFFRCGANPRHWIGSL